MLEPIIIRPLFGRVVAVVVVTVVVVGLGFLVVSRPAEALRISWIPLLIAAIAWITLWLPAVSIADDAVTVRNVFSTIRVPWPAIQRVDTKWALTLETEHGNVVAWAAPAPGRHTTSRLHAQDAANLPESAYLGNTVRPGDVPRSDSGDAATVIRFRLEELRDAPAREAGPDDIALVRTPHLVTIGVVVVLTLAAIVALIV